MLSAPGMVPAAASSRDLTSMSRARPEARSERSSGSETVGAEEGGTRAWSGARRPSPGAGAGAGACGPPRPPPPRLLPGAPRAPGGRGEAPRLPAGTSGHGARRDGELQECGPGPPPPCPQHLPRLPEPGPEPEAKAPPPDLPPRHLFARGTADTPAGPRFLRLPGADGQAWPRHRDSES